MIASPYKTGDIDDLRLLADIIGVDSADAALRICTEFYPDEPVSHRSTAVLHELSADDLLTPTIPRRTPAPRRKPRPNSGSSPSRHLACTGVGFHVLATIPRMQWLMTVFADGDE